MPTAKFLIIFIVQIIISVYLISRKKKVLSYIFELALPIFVILFEIYKKCFDLYEIPIYLIEYIIAKICILLIVIILKYIAFFITANFAKKNKDNFFYKLLGRNRFIKFLQRYNNVKYGPRLKLGYPAKVNSKHSETGIKFDFLGFPVFKSFYTVKLKRKYWHKSREVHFYQAGINLYNATKHNPALRRKFTKIELKLFSEGEVPKRFTWHHHQNSGVLQLVEYNIHSKTNHIGGFSIWGEK